MQTEFISIIALLLYTVSSLLLLRLLKQNQQRPQRLNAALILAWLAIGLHALILQRLIIQGSHLDLSLGLNLGFSNSCMLVSWLITVILLFAAAHLPIITLGTPMLLICALSIVLALIFPSEPKPHHQLTPVITLHIVLSMLAYSVLSLGSLQAILLYIQDFRLHQHKQDKFTLSLPSLQKMEAILFALLSIGFILLTIALALGLPYTQHFFTHKIIFSLIAWLVFGMLLLGHKLAGWRGRTAIRWTLAGIVSLLLAFFGSMLVFEFILNR